MDLKHLCNRPVIDANVAVREEMLEGQKHLVVPVIMLTEGVHNDLFYPASEIAKFPEAWNGIPVPVQHPVENGEQVSCNTPEFIERQSVGRIFNSYFDSDANALKGEVWINVSKAQKIWPGYAQQIHSNLEISTGLWTEGDGAQGMWNDEAFLSTLINYRPDHLALLPSGQGACSWQDGCGIRVNQQKKESDAPVFISNAPLSHSDIRSMINAVLNSMDVYAADKGIGIPQPSVYHYAVQIYSNYFIYERESGDGRQYFKQAYKISKDKSKVELTGDPEEVVKQVKYVKKQKQVNLKANKSIQKEDKTMADKCCENASEYAAFLIANDQTRYTDDDKEWLEGLEVEVLEKMVPVVKDLPTSNDSSVPKTDAQIGAEKGAVAVTPILKKKDDESAPKVQTVEEYIANAPAGMRDTLDRAFKRDQKVKTGLVEKIMANKRNEFTKEFLESKPLDELEGLAALANVQSDYSLNSGIRKPVIVNDDIGVPDPPKLFATKSK